MRRGEAVAGQARRFHNWLIIGWKPAVSISQAQRQVDIISRNLDSGIRLEQEQACASTRCRRRSSAIRHRC
jgi:hypothetical protein